MENEISVKELLDRINPSSLDYTEWVKVGMILKREGLTAADWEGWSKRNVSHQSGQCFQMWENLIGEYTQHDLSIMANQLVHSTNVSKLSAYWSDKPIVEPQLIKGLLRRYQKMAVCGPRRSSKTMGLIELSVAVAEGHKWLEWECVKGKVLFVNTDSDANSCMSRFKSVYAALDIEPANLSNVDSIHVRGQELDVHSLVNRIIELSQLTEYKLVIIDSIDGVINGELNRMTNQALDKICNEVGCCLVYSHSVDRTKEDKKNIKEVITNSIVLDYCDTYLEFVELDPDESTLVTLKQSSIINLYKEAIKEGNFDYYNEIPPDEFMFDIKKVKEYAIKALSADSFLDLKKEEDRLLTEVNNKTAWRLYVTSKGFPRSVVSDYWFEYPIHLLDQEKWLSELEPGIGLPLWKHAAKGKLPLDDKAKLRSEKLLKVIQEYRDSHDGVSPSKKELARSLGGVSIKTVERRIKESGEFVLVNGRYELKL